MTRGQRGPRQRAFLAAFAVTASMQAACRIAGIGSRNTVYHWRARDPEFAARFRDAEIEATELLEAEAWRRAMVGVVVETPILDRGELIGTVTEMRKSDTLLMFLLKARKPVVYRERIHVQASARIPPGAGAEASPAGGQPNKLNT
jgi:hypothetical protein